MQKWFSHFILLKKKYKVAKIKYQWFLEVQPKQGPEKQRHKGPENYVPPLHKSFPLHYSVRPTFNRILIQNLF